MNKVLELKKNQIMGRGRFGIYFATSQTKGVKITGKGYENREFILKNIKKNKNLQNIVKETTIGVLAEKATIGLKIIKFQGRFFLGIEQKNLKPLETPNLKTISQVKKDLLKKKIVHGDLDFGRNIMADKQGRPTVIDFDPERSFFVGDKSQYYSVKNLLIKEVLLNKNLIKTKKSNKIK